MQRPTRLSLPILVLVLAAAPALASGNANFVFGVRNVDTGEDDLSEVEDQGALGVNVDFTTGDLPFAWVIGFHVSGAEEDVDLGPGFEGDLSFGLAELSFGLGWTWEAGSARPYVGGGLTLVSAAVDLDLDVPGFDFDADDESGALYGDGASTGGSASGSTWASGVGSSSARTSSSRAPRSTPTTPRPTASSAGAGTERAWAACPQGSD